MISDRDIFAAANLFILQHGREAAIHATMRADEFGAVNDLNGQRAWLRIIEAKKKQQKRRRVGRRTQW